MPTLLTARATEGSTYAVTIPFTDEDGDPVVPNEVLWTLTDEDGEIVNAREDVIETPASSVEIALSGDDLPVNGRLVWTLFLTVEATYDSDLGTDLPLVAQSRIEVIALEVMPDDTGS